MVHVDAVHVVVEEIPDGHGEVVVAVDDGELAQDAPHALHGPGAVLGAVRPPGHMLRAGEAHQTQQGQYLSHHSQFK